MGWKDTERAIAKRVKGKRVGPSGRNTPDVITSWLAIECKERRQLPQWLKDAVQQARDNGERGKLAMVVLHESGRWHNNDLVLMRLRDFEAWFCDCQDVAAIAKSDTF